MGKVFCQHLKMIFSFSSMKEYVRVYGEVEIVLNYNYGMIEAHKSGDVTPNRQLT